MTNTGSHHHQSRCHRHLCCWYWTDFIVLLDPHFKVAGRNIQLAKYISCPSLSPQRRGYEASKPHYVFSDRLCFHQVFFPWGATNNIFTFALSFEENRKFQKLSKIVRYSVPGEAVFRNWAPVAVYPWLGVQVSRFIKDANEMQGMQNLMDHEMQTKPTT